MPSPTPSPAGLSPTPPTAAEAYAQIRAAVEQLRGLQPTAAVEPVTIDAAQLRSNLEAEFDRAHTPASLANTEGLLIALGLLPAGASLRALTLDFQAGQVAGYYSPEQGELFVVNRSGGLGAVELVTYAHEFTHQLQDQRIGLDSLGLDVADQSDRSLARLAVVEGDATSVQTTWMTANLDPHQLGQLLGSALDPASLEAFQRAPAFLRDTALFPYQDGLAFVSRLVALGGYARVDAAYADPPDSTEQILHPNTYLDREPPIEATVPDGLAGTLGAGWSEAARDTLGELILRIWLRAGDVSAAAARTAASGWGGDRVALFRGPDGATSVLLRTAWDTADDADEFATAARSALTALGLEAALGHVAGTARVDIAVGGQAAQLVAALRG